MKPIGWVHTPFPEKFGIPRQPGLAEAATGTLHLHDEFAQPGVFDGLSESTHLWLLFLFHAQSEEWSPKVRPPRLGGNQKIGVFACRTPRRPNPIGLSVVRLRKVEEFCLHLGGVDLLDGTPILDIKPYVPYTDVIPEAHCALASSPPTPLEVIYESGTEAILRELELLELTTQVLSQDPRPAFHKEGREYGTFLGSCNIRWRVAGEQITVFAVSERA